MEIKNVRVVNETLEDERGEVHAPTTFFMDVKLNDLDSLAVPINNETYITLSSLMAEGQPIPERTRA